MTTATPTRKTHGALIVQQRRNEKLIADTRLRFYRVTSFLHIADTATPPARWANAMLDASTATTIDSMTESLNVLQSMYERATGLTGI
jgi:hypothetical protein